MKELRINKRVKHLFEVKCSREGSDMFIAKVLDLSSSGIRVMSDRDFSINETLDIEIPAEKHCPPIKVKGRIVWQKPHVDKFNPEKDKGKTEIGVHFIDIDNQAKRMIFSFISEIERTRLTVKRDTYTKTDMPF
jgi:c-di-GMP-binding flagellar brake protein YcgR